MSMFYTGKGDDGTTGFLGSYRITKNDPRIEALGSIDEAVAALGMARSQSLMVHHREILLRVQRDLYLMMAEVAAAPENATKFRSIGSDQLTWLEEQVNLIGERIVMPGEFIVPGDTVSAACFDVARTVVRRAERHLVDLSQRKEIQNSELLRYLNRLSSLCFVLELAELQASEYGKPTLARTDE